MVIANPLNHEARNARVTSLTCIWNENDAILYRWDVGGEWGKATKGGIPTSSGGQTLVMGLSYDEGRRWSVVGSRRRG
jgi:hypothetical protein